MITLHQVAPWNSDLRNPYRTRYATADGRYFQIEAKSLDDFWWVYEIDADGRLFGLDPSQPDRNPSSWYVGMCSQLEHARLAIELRVNGASEAEIGHALHNAPRPGTGKNAPRNVAARRGRR